ncbi:MAG: hypothetical protein IPK88_09275 [Saprospiraceae bacterium]|nr:hypothetical protein [Candidatus Defluviibacterium haderslevense]
MEISFQQIILPNNCIVNKNVFSTYDPEIEYSEEKSLAYLQEDLLQLEFKNLNLVIDLGWYGESRGNLGAFKIYVIKDFDWENPIKIETSKSQKEITLKLEQILSEIPN